MSKRSYNQTQFSTEDPLVHGRIELPPEEVDPEELAEQQALFREKRKKVVMVLGFILVLVALIAIVITSWKPAIKSLPELIEEEVITPTPKEMTLREEINQLILEVDKSNRASRTLVFPPVKAELRIELP